MRRKIAWAPYSSPRKPRIFGENRKSRTNNSGRSRITIRGMSKRSSFSLEDVLQNGLFGSPRNMEKAEGRKVNEPASHFEHRAGRTADREINFETAALRFGTKPVYKRANMDRGEYGANANLRLKKMQPRLQNKNIGWPTRI